MVKGGVGLLVYGQNVEGRGKGVISTLVVLVGLIVTSESLGVHRHVVHTDVRIGVALNREAALVDRVSIPVVDL